MKPKTKNPIAQERGRKGGNSTKKKYGVKHYVNMGKKSMTPPVDNSPIASNKQQV